MVENLNAYVRAVSKIELSKPRMARDRRHLISVTSETANQPIARFGYRISDFAGCEAGERGVKLQDPNASPTSEDKTTCA